MVAQCVVMALLKKVKSVTAVCLRYVTHLSSVSATVSMKNTEVVT